LIFVFLVRRKKSSNPSVDFKNAVYDEIDDNDVMSINTDDLRLKPDNRPVGDRASMTTIDNPYFAMPISPSSPFPQSREYGNMTYINTSGRTIGDNPDVTPHGSTSSRYQNRTQSVDSLGYTMSVGEREKRKRYVK